jgi:hypothetical protein
METFLAPEWISTITSRDSIHTRNDKIGFDIVKIANYAYAGLGFLAFVLVHTMNLNCSDTYEYGFQYRSDGKHLLGSEFQRTAYKQA